MVEEKDYFEFHLGKFVFRLRNMHDWTDRNTGKVHMRKRFSIYTIDDYEYQYWLEFYSGWRWPEFVYDTAEYEGNRHNIHFSLGYGEFYIHFPWRNKKITEEDINNPQPKYGFYLYPQNGMFTDFVYYVNRNGKNDSRRIYMPWNMEFYRHSIYLKDGSWWTMLDKERSKARKAGIDTWKDERYHLDYDSPKILKHKFPFKYVTKGGEVQETTATCYMEEREWRPKWFQWTSLFAKVKTSLEISFCDEMGNQRGSWKGGVLGVGCDVTQEEKANVDMESALRRYEEKVNRLHDYDR